MPAESLAEYLVKLGFDVDKFGFNKAKEAIESIGEKAKNSANSLISNFAKASSSVFGAVLSLNKGMLQLVSSVASTDLQVATFARTMWTSKESARNFTNALNVMGKSYNDLFYMTKEEFSQFLELRNLSATLKPPAGLQETLRFIRSIGQEINKMKIIANNMLQWVVYYLGQMLGKDFQKIKNGLKSINQWLMDKMPVITEKIAKLLVIVYKFGKAVVETISIIIKWLGKLWDSLSNKAKNTIGVIAGLVTLLKMGPIGWLIAALIFIVGLIDDIATWKRGGKSAFGEYYEKISKWFNTAKGQKYGKVFDEIKDSANKLLEKVWDLFSVLGDLFASIWEFLDESGAITAFLNTVKGSIDSIVAGVSLITDGINLISGNSDKIDMETIGQRTMDFMVNPALQDWFKDKFSGVTKWSKEKFDDVKNMFKHVYDWFGVPEEWADGSKSMQSTTSLSQNTTNNETVNTTVNVYGNANANDVAGTTSREILKQRKRLQSMR